MTSRRALLRRLCALPLGLLAAKVVGESRVVEELVPVEDVGSGWVYFGSWPAWAAEVEATRHEFRYVDPAEQLR